jgi:hypothetical protein
MVEQEEQPLHLGESTSGAGNHPSDNSDEFYYLEQTFLFVDGEQRVVVLVFLFF